jgi:hypothetical protein
MASGGLHSVQNVARSTSGDVCEIFFFVSKFSGFFVSWYISRLERFRSSAQGTKKAIPKLRSRASLHWMEFRLYILASPWNMFAAIPLPFEFLHALEHDINLPPIFYCSRSVWVSDTRPGSESRTENVSLQNSRLVPRVYTVPLKFKTYIDSWTWRAGRVITWRHSWCSFQRNIEKSLLDTNWAIFNK